MFKINSDFQYIYHLVSTKAIADAVKNDLQGREYCERPDLITVEDQGNDWANWDPGGTMWVSDEYHEFQLDGILIKVYKQHLAYFIHAVNNTKEREWIDTKYYKIHSGYMACLCITPEEFIDLSIQINDMDVIAEADMMYEHKLDVIDASGIVMAHKQMLDDGTEVISKLKRKEKILH